MQVSTSAKPEPSFASRVRQAGQSHLSQIEELRDRNLEELENFEINHYEFFEREKWLDRLDPKVQRARVKGWQAAARSLVGGAAGAFLGYQGGWAAGLATGTVGTAAMLRRAYQNDLLEVDEGFNSVIAGGVMGLLSAAGGPFGAVVSGITGAVIGAKLPTLFTRSPYGKED